MPIHHLPRFPYGAVYFRKSNPPRQDWARDYQTAAEDGMNIFRHWFLWSAIEVAPGVYDWEEYDRQLDLAAANGIKTIIGEMITAAPEWAFRQYAHARFETRDGRKVESHMGGSCVTGGFPGLCLDNEDWRAHAERFLTELVNRYQDHPGLGGYDLWNECNYGHDLCYCPATAAKFREWLQAKYGDVQTLGEAWFRHSLADWEDVTPPRALGPYPDTLDWLQFRIDDAYRLLRWRRDLVRRLDPEHAIVAHGIVGSLSAMAPGGADDWRAANEVEVYGYTWGSSRHGDEPWKQFHAVDLVRAAARGKPFWHAEAYGGPLWMQPQVIGKPRDEGRIASPEDIRYWNLVSAMAGAQGWLFLRWRPLLDGPLFGAFGPYGMDGSRTPRSEMASKVGRWMQAPEQAGLRDARPIKGDIGILYIPETQLFTYAQQGSTAFYADSMRGAYQGFFANNIQADWVHLDHMDEYQTLYLPFPVMLTRETAQKLRAWVEAGGTLISEGCPGYFGDRGHVGTVQPNLGLDELFGARESYVEFTPDLLGDLEFHVWHTPVWGGIFMQTYEPTSGTPVGWYADGRVAAVDHTYGQGRTRLIGTMAGAGYAAHPGPRSVAFFRDVLSFAGVEPQVRCSEARVQARLHAGPGGVYLWVANPTRQALPVRVELSQAWGPFASARALWGADAAIVSVTGGRQIALTAPGRDVCVLALE
ncbi:MAG: beta-galactosidase [Chloroflexi bacterium]|jgi:beta-galactosidase|nr:beta-galactosidase [Chloroflexota bacterium]